MNGALLLAALTGSALLAVAGVDHDKSLRLLEAQGLSNVVLAQNTRLGCSEYDDYGTRFAGIGAAGKVVTGVVCGRTWIEGITIRYD